MVGVFLSNVAILSVSAKGLQNNILLSSIETNVNHDGNSVNYNIDDYANTFTSSSIQLSSRLPVCENKVKKSVSVNLFSASATDINSTANNPPVAGLTYVILNPASLINGKITTATQIAWLWEYNGVKYTYDPDGDAITNMYLDGIPSDAVIGNITQNTNTIGFATQISIAGQYFMTFKVGDVNGALSNVVSFTLNVEPTDGNSRPVCSLATSSTNIHADENVLISWANSSDADASDTISDIKIKIVDSNGNYEYISDTSKYFDQLVPEEKKISLKFDEPDVYEVWVCISDNHNAWSNWVGFNVTSTSSALQMQNVQLVSNDPNNTYKNAFTWVNYQQSKTLANQVPGPQELYDYLRTQPNSNVIPFSGTILSSDWAISGTVLYEDGTPKANSQIKITMPLNSSTFQAQVTTDNNGYFSFSPETLEKYYGLYVSPIISDNQYLTGTKATYARYGNYYTTSFFIPTQLNVSVLGNDSISYSQNVIGMTGGSLNILLADTWYCNQYTYSSNIKWRDLPLNF